jgi:hypothetical protein
LLTRAVLIPGQSAKSLIIQAVEGAVELKMPPGSKLPLEAIAALRQWIDAGAPWQQQEAKGETTLDPDEVHAFVNDRSPEAFRKVVDRLLASPHYMASAGRATGSTSYANAHSIPRMLSVLRKNICSIFSGFSLGSFVPSSMSFSPRMPSRLAATVVNG